MESEEKFQKEDLQAIGEIFEVIHMIEIEKGKNIIKQTPKPYHRITKPIWCNSINKIQRKQVESFYKNRLESFHDLMKISKRNGKYELNLDFINYYSDYFYIDEDCLCRTLNLKKIGGGKAGIVYTIVGNDSQFDFIVKQIPNVGLNLYLSLRIGELRDTLTQRNEAFYINSFQMKKKVHGWIGTTKYYNENRYCIQVPSDNFTNQTLLHMILNEYLGDNPNYLYQYDSFYCSNGSKIDGYNITEFANSGDLSRYIGTTDITIEILINIIKQIMTPLFVLKHPMIGFLHSDLKPKNIFVNMVSGVPQFKIADFDKSSIFYKNIRFYNDNFNYTIGSINTTPFQLHKSHAYYYYSLKDTNFYGKYIGFHEFIMSNPEGFYTSFDIYTFFYSLLLEPKVYECLLNNPKNIVWDIYEYLFHESEETEWSKFLDNIKEIHSGKIKGETTSIKFHWEQFKLNGFKLRYHIDDVYSMLDINIQKIKDNFPSETIDLIKIDKPSKETLYISYDNHLCSIEPNEDDKECKTNIYSKISKDPRDKGYSYLYNYDYM